MSFDLTPRTYLLVPFEHWEHEDEWRFELVEFTGLTRQIYSTERRQHDWTKVPGPLETFVSDIQKTTLYHKQFVGPRFSVRCYVHPFDEEMLIGQLNLVSHVIELFEWFKREAEYNTRAAQEARMRIYCDALRAGIINLDELKEHVPYGDLQWDGSEPKI
jgi:hypothetical protein